MSSYRSWVVYSIQYTVSVVRILNRGASKKQACANQHMVSQCPLLTGISPGQKNKTTSRKERVQYSVLRDGMQIYILYHIRHSQRIIQPMQKTASLNGIELPKTEK